MQLFSERALATPASRALLIFAMGAMLPAFTPHSAEASDLSGTWRGGGSVSFVSGKAERAKCRATFSKLTPVSYAMNATCATSSGSVSQSATVRKRGTNSYGGSFYNSEWDTSGTISIAVSGRSLNAKVRATKGSSTMNLSR